MENENNSQEKNLEENQSSNENLKKESNDSFEPDFTIREMLEAGVHFGHRTARWNAKMAQYIYGIKNKLHIIDLTQTANMLDNNMKILREVVKRNGKILFVCTKKQGAEAIKKVASDNNQFYVTNKWLGGMLTNWKTISRSIKTLKQIEYDLANPNYKATKKEKLLLDKKRQKLEDQLGGIKDMEKTPDLLFVIDTPREDLAIREAKSLDIPVMAIIDTNSDPDLIDYPIPGNDDSIKAIDLYARIINQALEDGNKHINHKETNNNKHNNDKKPTKSSKKLLAIKKDKLPVKAKEAKVPAVKKENKVPSVKKEAKTPAVVENK